MRTRRSCAGSHPERDVGGRCGGRYGRQHGHLPVGGSAHRGAGRRRVGPRLPLPNGEYRVLPLLA